MKHETMKKIRITQVKSSIDRPERQKLTLKALGLNKMNASREVQASAQILGMVRAVNHLLKVEEFEVEGGQQVSAGLEERREMQPQGAVEAPASATKTETAEPQYIETPALEREEQAI